MQHRDLHNLDNTTQHNTMQSTSVSLVTWCCGPIADESSMRHSLQGMQLEMATEFDKE